MNPSPRQITCIVNTISLSAWGGPLGEGAPASNEGIVIVSPSGGMAGAETIHLTGPGTNAHLTVSVAQYLDRVSKIYRSYCYRTAITVTLLDVPGQSFPLITDIS